MTIDLFSSHNSTRNFSTTSDDVLQLTKRSNQNCAPLNSPPTAITDGYSMSDIIYFWKDGEKSIGIDESLTLPQFSVAGIKQRDKKVVLSTGNYSRLLCEIQLIRSMGYYMIQVYFTSTPKSTKIFETTSNQF